ncbi:MAG: Fic/DOC family protein [Fimbriimonadaceae bacterium]
MSRYSFGGENEDTFEPGSGGLVLKNKIGVTDPSEIGLAETQALDAAYLWSLDEYETISPFSLAEPKRMHSMWLGSIYEFAGQFRTVNISKGDTLFAPIEFFEKSCGEVDLLMIVNTPCDGLNKDALVERISLIHGELLLLHPFREGNGRIARWLADLMSLQAGFGMLNWEFGEKGEAGREEYFAALRLAYSSNFTSLQTLVRNAIDTGQF